MKQDELASIRRAIDDVSAPKTHEDGDIEQILDLLRNRHLVIAHFLLGDAIALSTPSIPTAPTFDDAPAEPTLTSPPTKSTSVALEKWRAVVDHEKYLSDLETRKWEQKKSSQLQKYTQEIASFRAEQSTAQLKLELRQAHAKLYLDMAAGGGA